MKIDKKLLWLIHNLFFLFVIVLVLLLSPLRVIRKTLGRRKIRSIWSGTPIMTMASNAKAERLLGVDARSLVFWTYYVSGAFDYDLSKWCAIPLARQLILFLTFIWTCVFIDRVHFYCDRGFIPSGPQFVFNSFELYVYKLLRIQVFFWTYGADVRSRQTTKNLGEPNCCSECTMVGEACVCDEARRMRNIEKLRKYSTAIFSMGDMSEYTPGSRNDLFFWPVDLHGPNASRYEPVYPEVDQSRPLRIIHAPNQPAFKGTHFLIEAVEALNWEHLSIELILVEKVPNERALALYRSADIIFDQCLTGFHGYVALEAMTLGKPVLCFIRKPQAYLLNPEECPIINTHVTTLKEDLRRLAQNREQLTGIGVKGRHYVERHFSLEAFASRLEKAYKELGVVS